MKKQLTTNEKNEMWSCFSYELPNLQLIDNICHTTEQRFIF